MGEHRRTSRVVVGLGTTSHALVPGVHLNSASASSLLHPVGRSLDLSAIQLFTPHKARTSIFSCGFLKEYIFIKPSVNLDHMLVQAMAWFTWRGAESPPPGWKPTPLPPGELHFITAQG